MPPCARWMRHGNGFHQVLAQHHERLRFVNETPSAAYGKILATSPGAIRARLNCGKSYQCQPALPNKEGVPKAVTARTMCAMLSGLRLPPCAFKDHDLLVSVYPKIGYVLFAGPGRVHINVSHAIKWKPIRLRLAERPRKSRSGVGVLPDN